MIRRRVIAVLCSAFVLWPSGLGAQAELVSSGEVVTVSVLTDDAIVGETTAAVDDPEADENAERRRALLIAAVISAVTVLAGGALFERRRKRSEAELASGRADDGDRLADDKQGAPRDD